MLVKKYLFATHCFLAVAGWAVGRHSIYVPKPNALDQLVELALRVRDTEEFWVPRQSSPTGDSRNVEWVELEEVPLRGRTGKLFAQRKPLRYQPEVLTIELKLKVPGLQLRFSPCQAWRRPERPPKKRKHRRKERAALRNLYRRYEVPRDQVLLAPDDQELKAFVALRCVQQEPESDLAYHALRALQAYVTKLSGTAKIPDSVRDTAVSDLVLNFTTTQRAGALPKNVRILVRAAYGRERDTTDTRSTADRLFSVRSAAIRTGIPVRTLYRWLDEGKLAAADTTPSVLVSLQEVNRAKELAERKPGALYRAVANARGCSYDAARMWVQRRRDRGMSDEGLLREARGAAGADGNSA